MQTREVQKIFVRIREEGLKVPYQQGGGYYSFAGEWTQRTSFVTRRLRDGSLVEIKPPLTAAKRKRDKRAR